MSVNVPPDTRSAAMDRPVKVGHISYSTHTHSQIYIFTHRLTWCYSSYSGCPHFLLKVETLAK